jgi:hypothetical protein
VLLGRGFESRQVCEVCLHFSLVSKLCRQTILNLLQKSLPTNISCTTEYLCEPAELQGQPVTRLTSPASQLRMLRQTMFIRNKARRHKHLNTRLTN